MKFYEDLGGVKNRVVLRQGDILSPVPFVSFLVESSNILGSSDVWMSGLDLTTSDPVPAGTRVLANLDSSIGLVMTQCCDLEPRDGTGFSKPLLVARVYSCRDKIAKFKDSTPMERVKSFRQSGLENSGKRPSLFYLPPSPDPLYAMPASVTDLLEVQAFPPNSIRSFAEHCLKLRLSHDARQALQERLAYCFGRFGSPSDLYFTDEDLKWA